MFRNSRIRSFIKPNEKRRVQKYLSLRQALYYLHLHSNKKKRFRVSLTPFRLNLEVQRNDFFWAFVIGGLICVIGQLMFDVGKLTPAHTMATLVVAGAILDGFNLYEPLIDFAGAGQLYLLQALVMPSFMAQWKKRKTWHRWRYYRHV